MGFGIISGILHDLNPGFVLKAKLCSEVLANSPALLAAFSTSKVCDIRSNCQKDRSGNQTANQTPKHLLQWLWTERRALLWTGHGEACYSPVCCRNVLQPVPGQDLNTQFCIVIPMLVCVLSRSKNINLGASATNIIRKAQYLDTCVSRDDHYNRHHQHANQTINENTTLTATCWPRAGHVLWP